MGHVCPRGNPARHGWQADWYAWQQLPVPPYRKLVFIVTKLTNGNPYMGCHLPTQIFSFFLHMLISWNLSGQSNSRFMNIMYNCVLLNEPYVYCSDADPFELFYGSGSWILRFSIRIQIQIQGGKSYLNSPPPKLNFSKHNKMQMKYLCFFDN